MLLSRFEGLITEVVSSHLMMSGPILRLHEGLKSDSARALDVDDLADHTLHRAGHPCDLHQLLFMSNVLNHAYHQISARVLPVRSIDQR